MIQLIKYKGKKCITGMYNKKFKPDKDDYRGCSPFRLAQDRETCHTQQIRNNFEGIDSHKSLSSRYEA